MRRILTGPVLLVAIGGFCWAQAVRANEPPEIHAKVSPFRYNFVSGDVDTFSAHHWTTDGFAGGLDDLSAHYTLPDGTQFETEVHALPHQNDYGAEVLLRKESLGFLTLEYSEFRKYYDRTGKAYKWFSQLSGVDTFKDPLQLDIGTLGFETGLTLDGWPEFSFGYEREFKDGAKSRATLATATEGGFARKILPSWQDIDEVVDAFTLSANHEIAGFELTGQQHWEFVRSELFRFEKQESTNTTASEKKIRTQDQAPEADLMTTLLGGQRWFLGEKLFVSTGYHFAHLDNREFETLLEYNEAGVLTAFSNPEIKPNNRADNDYDSHTWVQNVSVSPWPWLNVGTKLKTEVVRHTGNSTYNADDGEAAANGGTPDGLINHTELSQTDTKAVRWGEAFSLRYTGIPLTALYSELELEQARVLLREDRQSLDGPDAGNGSNANEVFNRETVTDVRRGAVTLGGQVAPFHFLNVTAHVRHRRNNNDYDDQRESTPGGSTARSAFVDEQQVHGNEFVTKLTLRPCRWFRSSVRYQFRDDDYRTRVEAQPVVEAEMLSHIYTYDVTLQPIRPLTTTAAFSRQDAWTRTPARLASSASTQIPAFDADVNSWLFTTDYAVTPTVSLTNNLLVSWANNFNETNSDVKLFYGVDERRVDVVSGIRWAPKDHLSLAAEYGYYFYQPDSNAARGDYDAHMISFEISTKF